MVRVWYQRHRSCAFDVSLWSGPCSLLHDLEVDDDLRLVSASVKCALAYAYAVVSVFHVANLAGWYLCCLHVAFALLGLQLVQAPKERADTCCLKIAGGCLLQGYTAQIFTTIWMRLYQIVMRIWCHVNFTV